MRVEIINTGSELLLGRVTNTHLPYLAQSLALLGFSVDFQSTVPDGPAIAKALEESFTRADLILVTGGLGPTSDDVTRDLTAQLLKRPLQFHPEIWQGIETYFTRRGITPSDLARAQAMVPEGAQVIPNHHGTAPGLWIEEGDKLIILLPGPPRELQPMWQEEVMPRLRKKFPDRAALPHRIWCVACMGETTIQELVEAPLRDIGDFEVGYCPRVAEVEFRLIAQSEKLLEKAAKVVAEKLGEAIFAFETSTLEKAVIEKARAKKRKVATAESCTGGLIAHRLTNVPGSSEVLEFGWVTYGNNAKVHEVGVAAEIISKHGAVSEACVRAMALGARQQSGADFAVAVSGIAGPDGGTPEKPVGLVWFALASAAGVVSFQKQFGSTDREHIKWLASQYALDALRKAL